MLNLRILIICFLSIFLFGCSQHKSDSYYIRHPNKLKAILDSCETLNAKQIKQNQKCLSAIHTFKHIAVLTHDLMHDQYAFGKRILSAQMKQAKLFSQMEALQKQLKFSKIKAAEKEGIKKGIMNISRKISALKEQVHTMSTLIAVAEGF